jgi:hypothetical protein
VAASTGQQKEPIGLPIEHGDSLNAWSDPEAEDVAEALKVSIDHLLQPHLLAVVEPPLWQKPQATDPGPHNLEFQQETSDVRSDASAVLVST